MLILKELAPEQASTLFHLHFTESKVSLFFVRKTSKLCLQNLNIACVLLHFTTLTCGASSKQTDFSKNFFVFFEYPLQDSGSNNLLLKNHLKRAILHFQPIIKVKNIGILQLIFVLLQPTFRFLRSFFYLNVIPLNFLLYKAEKLFMAPGLM